MSKRAPDTHADTTDSVGAAKWGEVMRETRPLSKRKTPLAKAPLKKQTKKPETQKPSATPNPKAKPHKIPHAPKPPITNPLVPPSPHHGLDPKLSRDLKNQRRKPDARCTLRHLPLAKAEERLKAFVQDKGVRGAYLVLVITGQYKNSAGVPQGVIRRSLPNWLENPEIAAWVIAWQQAYRHDGGEGAFYLTLRKRKW